MKTILISILLLINLNANSNQRAKITDAQYQYHLGLECKNSKNRNFRDAFKWMHKSAIQGFAPAQYEFALMFHYGIGVRQNSNLARLWLRRASRNGDYRAKTVLYRFYAGEKVEPRDRNHRRYYSQNL